MSDPRLTPFNGRVAHVSLKSMVDADQFVDGALMSIQIAKAPLLRKPNGPMDRELLTGEGFLVLDSDAGTAYGFRVSDGYCGYVDTRVLQTATPPTHWVHVRETYWHIAAELKAFTDKTPLYFGSKLTVLDTVGDWAKVALRLGGDGADPVTHVYVPSCHLSPIDETRTDPVAVARLFLGTPYHWGGNSGGGIDCSGLVQAAYHACGFACAGDSDLQAMMEGEGVALAAITAGDLMFWKGHVAMATGPNTLIHANAHHMMVVEEPIEAAMARIAATETGEVTSILRPNRRPL